MIDDCFSGESRNNHFKSPKEGKTVLPETQLSRNVESGFSVATAMLEAGNPGAIPPEF